MTGTHSFDLALSADHVAKSMSGTSVYTVSNAGNEFVLVSDPNNSVKSLGLLCFRQEDAQALLAQVKVRQPVLGRGARVVPITLDQVYMLKVEGIAFRFLPDPIQIKNALQLKPETFPKALMEFLFSSLISWLLRRKTSVIVLYTSKRKILNENLQRFLGHLEEQDLPQVLWLEVWKML